MKPWLRVIIFIIIGLILIIAVYYAWGYLPEDDITTFLYPERMTLFKYYVCSMAMCTKGCGDEVLDNICIENKTGGEACDLSCKDLCESRWPDKADSGPGEVCGPMYSLNLSLKGQAPIKGCYKVDKSLIPAVPVPQCCKYIYHTWAQDKSIQIHEGDPDFPVLKPDIVDAGCLDQAWGMDKYRLVPGIILKESDITDKYILIWGYVTSKGIGAIRVSDAEYREKWGCFDRGCGADTCTFYGDLNLWAINYRDCGGGDHAADVIINSTLKGEWWFDITAKPLSQTIAPGETADYTITIDNYLGTKTDFELSYLYAHPVGPNCVFSPDVLTIEDGESGESTMSCTPTEVDEYGITIKVKPKIGISHYTYVELKVSEFDLNVIPGHKHTGIGIGAPFTVKITNRLGSDEFFDLSSDDSDCIFNKDPLFVVDGTSEASIMTCTKDNKGSYTITVNAVGRGITKSDVVALTVGECWDIV